MMIPRCAQRHRCLRCGYYVCYDCAEHFVIGSKSEPRIVNQDLAAAFHAQVRRKQARREASVALSRYCDVADPSSGSRVRTETLGRRRCAVAEDCQHASFSDASFVEHALEPYGQEDEEDELEIEREEAPVELPTLSALSRCKTTGALPSGAALAAEVVGRAMLLVDAVAEEVAAKEDCLDGSWTPSVKGKMCSSASGGSELLTWLLGVDDQGLPAQDRWQALCEAAQAVMQQQPVVSEVCVPAKVFGDIHGQLRDLLLLFHFYGRPCQDVSFVFNGDFVDRGQHQLEVVALLFALKILFPDRIWLNRGNHEDGNQSIKVSSKGQLGFDRACKTAFGVRRGAEAFLSCQRTFEWLPLAARVAGRVLVLHGGLGDGKWTLEDLGRVQRPLHSNALTTALGGVVYNLLWSDPLQADQHRPAQSFGVQLSGRSKRGGSVMKNFGRDVTEEFCAREKLALVIRSHQFRSAGEGYELMHDGWLLRVFSARNYLGKHSNAAGIIHIGDADSGPSRLLVKPQVVWQLGWAAGKATESKDWPPQEPYCPRSHLMCLVRSMRPVVSCSLPRFLLCGAKREMNSQSVCCSLCGLAGLQCYLHCHGCSDYDLCLGCAQKLCNRTDVDRDSPRPTLLQARSFRHAHLESNPFSKSVTA